MRKLLAAFFIFVMTSYFVVLQFSNPVHAGGPNAETQSNNILLNTFRTVILSSLHVGTVDFLKIQDGVVQYFDSGATFTSGGETLTLDSNFETGGSGTTFGKVTTTSRASRETGMTFQATTTNKLAKISLRMLQNGSPTDNVFVEIYSLSSGLPNTLLATSDSLSGSSLPTGGFDWVDFIFSGANRINITSGTSYAIVLDRSGADSDTNNYSTAAKFSHESAPFFSNGQVVEDLGSGWVFSAGGANDDLNFRFFTTDDITQSDSFTSTITLTAERQPETCHLLLFEEDVDTINLNTDLNAFCSRDGGSTWVDVVLGDEGDYDPSKRLLSGTGRFDDNDPSGTNMVFKIEKTDKDLDLHGVGFEWD